MDEKLWPYIYLDLDETLIYTTYCGQWEPELNINTQKLQLGGHWYETQERPCAKDLIESCRRFGIVKILTAATKDYAFAISHLFDFRFEEDDIVARHDYVEWVPDGWGGYGGSARETPIAKLCVGHTNAVLVDNQTPDLPNARVKIAYLGISKDRYVVFPVWNGGEESPGFEEEYEEIKNYIYVLVSEVVSLHKGPPESGKKQQK